ncbi:MAG: hypothetical protein KKD28_07295 [Chloroflexi bacterium]|nr:hypothetical protein [Chloroflexota bacterium]MBU1661261.1 hypothetical protein [Chloroflexota bacterium]
MANLTNRSVVIIMVCLVGIGAAILLGPPFFGLSNQKETTNMIKNNVLSQDAIPPIDAITPANTETATFALG